MSDDTMRQAVQAATNRFFLLVFIDYCDHYERLNADDVQAALITSGLAVERVATQEDFDAENPLETEFKVGDVILAMTDVGNAALEVSVENEA